MNILICDANESDTNSLMEILNYSYPSDVEATVFRSAPDALSYIRSGAAADICFLETVTPEMDGIELARNLRAEGFAGEIIFISRDGTYGPETYEVKALYYLLKPPEPSEVQRAVDKAKNKRKRTGADNITAGKAVVSVAATIHGNSRFGRLKRSAGCFRKRLFDT